MSSMYDGLSLGVVEKPELDSAGQWTGRVWVQFDNLGLPSQWALFPSPGGNNDTDGGGPPTKGTRVGVAWTMSDRVPVVMNTYRIGDTRAKAFMATKKLITHQGEKGIQAVKINKDEENGTEEQTPSAFVHLTNDGNIHLKNILGDVEMILGTNTYAGIDPSGAVTTPPSIAYFLRTNDGNYKISVGQDGKVGVTAKEYVKTISGGYINYVGGSYSLNANAMNIIVATLISILAETLSAVISGNIDITADGDINITAPNVNITGDVAIDGSLSVSGDISGEANVNASAMLNGSGLSAGAVSIPSGGGAPSIGGKRIIKSGDMTGTGPDGGPLPIP